MTGPRPRDRWLPSRRALLAAAGALPFLGAFMAAAFARQTPRAAQGPFYPTQRMRFEDADNDLVRIEGMVREAGGEVMVLKGVVRDAEGKPVAGSRVEIWQCDANGRYLHSRDAGGPPRDPGFQGFGHVVTGADGGYAFRTIVPVPYPGRTPHIHVKVFHAGGELTTQFYIDGHPLNRGDFLFTAMSAEEQRAVSMKLAQGPDGTEAVVDIVV